MIASEDELQVAREAAAEVAYYRTYAGGGPVLPWRDLPVDTQVRFRGLVESLVAAALEALPDRAVAARKAGVEAVVARVRAHVCTCGGDFPGQPHETWCAASAVEELI